MISVSFNPGIPLKSAVCWGWLPMFPSLGSDRTLFFVNCWGWLPMFPSLGSDGTLCLCQLLGYLPLFPGLRSARTLCLCQLLGCLPLFPGLRSVRTLCLCQLLGLSTHISFVKTRSYPMSLSIIGAQSLTLGLLTHTFSDPSATVRLLNPACHPVLYTTTITYLISPVFYPLKERWLCLGASSAGLGGLTIWSSLRVLG